MKCNLHFISSGAAFALLNTNEQQFTWVGVSHNKSIKFRGRQLKTAVRRIAQLHKQVSVYFSHEVFGTFHRYFHCGTPPLSRFLIVYF